MVNSIVAITAINFGLGGMLLVDLAIYKTLFGKRKSGNMFIPCEDMTRGTNDTNGNKYIEEDTRHTVGIEETRNVK
jgi:hypothetical protein